MEYKQFPGFSRVSLRICTGFANRTLENQRYSANIRFLGGFSQVGQLLDEKYLHLAGLWDKLDVSYTWNLSSFIFVTLSFIFRMSRTFYCESLWLGMLTSGPPLPPNFFGSRTFTKLFCNWNIFGGSGNTSIFWFFCVFLLDFRRISFDIKGF